MKLIAKASDEVTDHQFTGLHFIIDSKNAQT